MNLKIIYFIILPTILISCNSDKKIKSNTTVKAEKITEIESQSVIKIDTIKTNDLKFQSTKIRKNDSIITFDVDNYPITNNMISKQAENNSLFKIKNNSTISIEKSWFTNKNQTLVIELATDYHRFFTYHFSNNEISDDIKYDIGFHTNDGELAEKANVIKDFDGFIKKSSLVDSTYFVSDKGFEIGSIKQKAINIYGSPDKTTSNNKVEKLEWGFLGDLSYYEKSQINGKAFAKGSFGHKITMYFKNNKLIAHVIFNDIP